MTATIAKWGNSLALRIPKDAAKELGFAEGTQVDFSLEDGTLVVRPSAPAASFNLSDLVARITEENRHDETETGAPVGNEVW
jgi:antitoxin MazE